jgi:pseudaminic acid synthase
MKNCRINNVEVGDNNRCFIIAELSANHNQDFDLAVKTIHAIKESGADAIKFQTYTADTITLNCNNDLFKIKTGSNWDGKSLHEIYSEAYTPWDWQPKLKTIAENLGLICFSSPFDTSAVDFLEDINVPAYKIASPEITDIPLIEYVASKGKPVMLSTGIAKLKEIEEAVEACKNQGNKDIVVLKCTTAYPAPYSEINLKTIPDIKERFKVIPGLSDHSKGPLVSVAAVALGAKVIEKHFILDRKLGGPDAFFSMEPKEFKTMVTSIRQVEQALGNVSYDLTGNMIKSREHRRSLFVVKDIRKGEIITSDNVRSIRPGNGLSPKFQQDILGEKVTVDIKKGTPFNINFIK